MSSEYLNSNAWPFVEARAILKRKGKALEKKGHVLFQTGYARADYLILELLEKFVEQLWSFRHLKKFLIFQ
jgi:hypothetical protein